MPDAKIKVEICCGTTCYMLGAAELLKLEDIVPEEWKDKLDVNAIPCLNACLNQDLGRAPFVKIDGELVANATLDRVFNLLNTRISGEGQNE